ncbi:MAG: GAF domain-containing sensor histidine kinase [Armatimonadetes bacterium]|nr:GAF domain-containing sensor histidine kinase [Armatimonadota bacterium]
MTRSRHEKRFALCISILTLPGLFLSIHAIQASNRMDVFFFAVLLFLFSFIEVPLPRIGIYFRLTAAILFGAVLVLGPAAAWIALLVSLANSGIRKYRWYAALFNGSHDFLCVGASAWVYLASGGRIPVGEVGFHSLLPALAAAGVLFLTDYVLTNFAVSVSMGKPPWHPLYDIRAALLDAGLFPLGILVSLCYSYWGVSSLLLVGFPILLTSAVLGYALRGTGQLDELKVVLDTASQINSSLDLEEILQAIVSRISKVVMPEECLIALLRSGPDEWMILDARKCGGPAQRIPAKEHARAELDRVQEGAVMTDGLTFPVLDSLFFPGRFPKMVFPVRTEGRIAGLIVLVTQSYFLEEHRKLVDIFAQQSGSAIKNARMYSDLKGAQARMIESSKMAALGQLAAGVAHEVNNPLAAILTSVQLMSGPQTDSELRQEGVRLIKEGIARCKKIVNQLLQYAHGGATNRDLGVHREVEVSQVVEDTLILFQESFRKVGIQVSSDYHPPCLVRANPQDLSQLFTNLLLNARDAVEERQEKGEIPSGALISIKTGSDDGYSFIEILDNGVGIQSEVLPRIFDPFFTTKEVGKGSGLGLANAMSIARKYGGDIQVSSKIGETLFSVKFPDGRNEIVQ